MASYEICYLDERRALTSYIATACVGDIQAVSFAHAMAPPGPVRVEVWRSGNLVCDFIRPLPADKPVVPTLVWSRPRLSA